MSEFLVCLGFILLGLSSWITINGVYSELSLIIEVYNIPESYSIASYIALLIQLSNIAVLCYAFIPTRYKTQSFIIGITYGILLFSFINIVVMAFTFDKLTNIPTNHGEDSHYYNLHLLLTTFGTAMCDCMTSVLFYTFVSWYPTRYIPILSAGESMSGLVVAAFIWCQQLGTDTHSPRYSATTFFLLLSALLPISALAFGLLVKYQQNINGVRHALQVHEDPDQPDHDNVIHDHNLEGNGDKKQPLIAAAASSDHRSSSSYFGAYWKYLFVLGLASGIQNGMLTSVATYALLPYGNQTYVLANTISYFVNPFSAALPSLHIKLYDALVNNAVINVLCTSFLLSSTVILAIALYSPRVIPHGSLLVILAYVACNASIACCKSCSIIILKQQFPHRNIENVGRMIQFGSFVVSVFFFLLIQYAGIFHE